MTKIEFKITVKKETLNQIQSDRRINFKTTENQESKIIKKQIKITKKYQINRKKINIAIILYLTLNLRKNRL